MRDNSLQDIADALEKKRAEAEKALREAEIDLKKAEDKLKAREREVAKLQENKK